jgi:hypothetical protein
LREIVDREGINKMSVRNGKSLSPSIIVV